MSEDKEKEYSTGEKLQDAGEAFSAIGGAIIWGIIVIIILAIFVF